MCSKQEVEDIAARAAKTAVEGVLETLGIDVTDAGEIRHFQANMMHLTRWRRMSQKVGMAVILTVVALATGGVVKVFWEGVKTKTGG